MSKKERKDYIYYNLSVPNELRILFEAFISKYPHLGFRNISQYLLHIIQEEAKKIIHENIDLREIKKIVLNTGTWELGIDGTYKKID